MGKSVTFISFTIFELVIPLKGQQSGLSFHGLSNRSIAPET